MISIIVPAYNVEKFIFNALSSIQKQTYKDLEVIVVDDGSTDSTLEIIEEFCSKDNRFKFLHKENGGQMSAYLLGLKYISGDYIGFVDPDDTISENMYEIMLKSLNDYNADIVVCEFNRYDVDTGELISTNNVNPFLIDENNIKDFYSRILPGPNSNGVSMSRVNKLFKKDIFMNNIKYLEMDVSRVMEDRRIVPACLWSAKRIYFIGKPLYNVTINRIGSSSGKFIPNLIDIIKTIHKIHEKELNDKLLFDLCEKNYNESLIDFCRIYLKRNVFNIDNKKEKKKYCNIIVKERLFRDCVLNYRGKKDKTLLALKFSMQLKNGTILYLFSKLYRNKVRNI